MIWVMPLLLLTTSRGSAEGIKDDPLRPLSLPTGESHVWCESSLNPIEPSLLGVESCLSFRITEQGIIIGMKFLPHSDYDGCFVGNIPPGTNTLIGRSAYLAWDGDPYTPSELSALDAYLHSEGRIGGVGLPYQIVIFNQASLDLTNYIPLPEVEPHLHPDVLLQREECQALLE